MLLTLFDYQAIPSRVWQTQNQQLKELEEYQDKQQLINLEKVDLETQLKK